MASLREHIMRARRLHEQLVLNYSGDPQDGPVPVLWASEEELREQRQREIDAMWEEWFRMNGNRSDYSGIPNDPED